MSESSGGHRQKLLVAGGAILLAGMAEEIFFDSSAVSSRIGMLCLRAACNSSAVTPLGNSRCPRARGFSAVAFTLACTALSERVIAVSPRFLASIKGVCGIPRNASTCSPPSLFGSAPFFSRRSTSALLFRSEEAAQ